MKTNISKSPIITFQLIESLFNEPSKTVELDDLKKYVVYKCLKNNATTEKQLANELKKIEKTNIYKNLFSEMLLLEKSIFTENDNEYKRFLAKTEEFDFDLLTSIFRGFAIKEAEKDMFYLPLKYKENCEVYDYDYNSILAKYIQESKNVLIEGPIKVGKTRLVFDVLKELKNYYVFSLSDNAFDKIDSITISDSFDKKGKKLIWFIDDLHFSRDIWDKISLMYGKLTAKLGDIIVIATLRSDRKDNVDSRLLENMETIEMLPWLWKEGDEFANRYGYSMSDFTGNAFSLAKKTKKMERIYNSKEISMNSKHVMRYLKLLNDLFRFVDYTILEKTYLYLRPKSKRTDDFEKSLIELERYGFILRASSYILSWEPFLCEIVTDKDYPQIDLHKEKLIELFVELKEIKGLNDLLIYYFYKKDFEKCILCNEGLSKILENEKDSHVKSVTYNNIGYLFFEIAKLNNNDKELYQKARDNYELAIKHNKDFLEAYENLGNLFYKLAELNNNDIKLYVKSFEYHEYTAKLKKDPHKVYYTLGELLLELARLNNNDKELYQKARRYYVLAIKCKKDYAEAYYSLGHLFYVLAKVNNNDKKLYQKTFKYYKLAVKHKEDFLSVYNSIGNLFCELAALNNKDKKLYKKACKYYELSKRYLDSFPLGYYNWGLALYESDSSNEGKIRALGYIFRSYSLHIFQNKLRYIQTIVNELLRISKEFNCNYEEFKMIIVVFEIATKIINHKIIKPSEAEYEILNNCKGKMGEIDLVIEAILNMQKPEGVEDPKKSTLLFTAFFLSNKIVETMNNEINN